LFLIGIAGVFRLRPGRWPSEPTSAALGILD
jgi:hypothetical protein